MVSSRILCEESQSNALEVRPDKIVSRAAYPPNLIAYHWRANVFPCVAAEISVLKFQNYVRLDEISVEEKRYAHNPSSTLAVRPFLSICPLIEELVRGIKLSRKSPFAEPERFITEDGIGLDALQI